MVTSESFANANQNINNIALNTAQFLQPQHSHTRVSTDKNL